VNPNHFVIAIDRINKRVLLGGLGFDGVGEMWFEMKDKYHFLPGYKNAVEKDSTGQFGTQEWGVK